MPGAHLGYAFHLSTRTRHEDAIAEGRRAVELAPLDLTMRTALAEHYINARRYDEALQELRKVIDMDPTFQRAEGLLGWVYEATGRSEEAFGAYERAGTLTPENASALRAVLSREGPRGAQREWLRLVRSAATSSRSTWLAGIHAQLGERDEAFAELERAYDSREGQLAFLRVSFRLDALRSDPRFDDLLRRIGFPES